MNKEILQHDIEQALNCLEPKKRILITLLFFEGLNKREIAQKTNVHYETVKVLIRKALIELREYLG